MKRPRWTETEERIFVSFLKENKLSQSEIASQLTKKFKRKITLGAVNQKLLQLRTNGKLKQYNSSPALLPAYAATWAEEEKAFLARTLIEGNPMATALRLLNDAFGRERTESDAQAILDALLFDTRKEETENRSHIIVAPAAKIAASKSYDLPVNEGRAVTISYPGGELRLLVSGSVPDGVRHSVSKFVGETLFAS